MKNFKNTFFYLIVTGGFTALIYWIISKGKFLESIKTASIVLTPSDHWNEFINSMVVNFNDPLAILLAQIITIIIVARFFWMDFQKNRATFCNRRNHCRYFSRTFFTWNVFPRVFLSVVPCSIAWKFIVLKPNWFNPIHVCYWNGIGFKSTKK